jgi:hypothetical protein
LKGLLVSLGEPFPRTHNLEELQHLGQALPNGPLAGLDLIQLSSYAVEVRYDFEFWHDRQTAQEAIGLALEVCKLVLGAVPPAARP